MFIPQADYTNIVALNDVCGSHYGTGVALARYLIGPPAIAPGPEYTAEYIPNYTKVSLVHRSVPTLYSIFIIRMICPAYTFPMGAPKLVASDRQGYQEEPQE